MTRPILAGVLVGLFAVSAQAAQIYSCVDGNGRRLTSDRPIRECLAREQRLLNADGSVKQVVPPTMTVDELAEAEAKKRQAELERAAKQDAVRRDRNLLARFPDEAAHSKAREAALDDVRKGVKFSEDRLVELQKERKPLLDELEFYKGKKLPLKLRQQLDANDAATTAQRSLVQNQKEEIKRIDSLYDSELARLRKLWAGAPAGSLPLAASPTPASGTKSAGN
ncbi:DUF4124 domain-containing protein [Piscinibacter gummiphilus]|uniref:DUF4124 domain-containing protein n=1 Tax=Piscinibacter gummiphilus TaxID=946333 RepID=A0ABZ0CU68_9BURK|nr:DUF4124 domain-containing protein [Piscinibacter gummiphilus]WOB08499.1 DUF4124 domain-containing protein [Piscinibacter gummiphilus]